MGHLDKWKIYNAVTFYFPTFSNKNMLDARMCESRWTLSQLMKHSNHKNRSNGSNRSSHSLLHITDGFIKAIQRVRRVQIVRVEGMLVEIACGKCMWKTACYVADCDFSIWCTKLSLICCFRMSRMVKTLFVIVVLALVLCDAQVNFSPNWGKRSGLQDGPCKASTEPLMYIYKMIQVTVKYFRTR